MGRVWVLVDRALCNLCYPCVELISNDSGGENHAVSYDTLSAAGVSAMAREES